MELTNPLNKNENAVIDKGILELERELSKLDPSGAPISQTTLSEVVSILNQRLRFHGESAANVQFAANVRTGKQIFINHQKVAALRKDARQKSNDLHNSKVSKSVTSNRRARLHETESS